MRRQDNNAIFEGEDEINFGRVLGTLLDHVWLIIGITLFFAAISVTYTLFATPVYEADAMVQVEQNEGNSLLSDLSSVLPDAAKPPSAAEIELIESRMVIGKTVDDLNLDVSVNQKYFPIFGKGLARMLGYTPGKIAISRVQIPEEWDKRDVELKVVNKQHYIVSNDDGVIIQGEVGKLESGLGVTLLVSDIEADDGTIFKITQQTKLMTINKLIDQLAVADKGKDTGVLELNLVGTDPFLVERILDSITKNYLYQNIERKSAEAEKSLEFLHQQLPQVRESLDEAESKLNAFRQANDSVDLSLEAKSLLDTMVSIETQLNQSTFSEADVSKLYTKEHPAYKALLEKRKTLEDEKDKLNRRIAEMPKTQQDIIRLSRDVEAGRAIYMQLLNKQQELSISKASTLGNVRIIDNAITQPRPVAPRKILIVVIITFLGCLFAVGVVLLKTLLHKGIENPEELEEIGLNVYATIPLSEWQQKNDRTISNKVSKFKKINEYTLLAEGNPADIAIEAIRSLRTSLHFAMMEAKNNVLMISGASPNIGKTFVSTNLAAVISTAGEKILLIDADMRKGYIHTLLNVDGANGLSDVISGKIDIEKAIHKTKIENLDFMTRGVVPPNPAELLMHKRFRSLVDWASKNYDIVIIDTPPVLAVTDAAIIGRFVGTTLLVARFSTNTLKEIEVCIRRFEQTGTEVKGIILNAIEKRASNYYGNYGYYQYNYGSHDKK